MERGVETSFQPVRQIWGNPQVLPRHHLSCHIYLLVRFEMKMVGGETQPIDSIFTLARLAGSSQRLTTAAKS